MTAETKVIAVMGPTAAGKTELALHLARELDGEVISVDSAQVYRGLDIGTAKPGPATLAATPHHLIDIRDPADPYSAAEFAADAARLVPEIAARGRVPILAGGTMLYFRALLEGLAPMPNADPAVRARLDAAERSDGLAALHGRLADVDPEAARRIGAGDPQRIKRALEVHELTGKTITALQRETAPPPGWPVLKLAVWPPERAMLHRRIAERFKKMIAAGFIDEVRGLYERGDLHEQLPAIRSVGYRQVWRYLDGRLDRAAMIEAATAATRQLAKRQMTWLRREAGVTRLAAAGPDFAGPALERARSFLRSRP